jgi:hypothetical protein
VSGVAVGQQCARRPLQLLPALGKLVVAAAVAAAAMALLAYAGSGRLGNFGDVGVDQATFAPAIFLWFVGIGALTVAMSGGIARRPKTPKRVPEPDVVPEPEPDVEPEEEPGPEVDEGEPRARTEAAAPVDDEDPEEHFVADDDTTGNGKTEAAD